jgi:hypothetical protein
MNESLIQELTGYGSDEATLTSVINPCLRPPSWEKAGKAHDWRNYARDAADAEEWE